MRYLRNLESLDLVLIAFCCLCAATLSLFYFPFTLEDAYITLHYSKAVALGNGIGAWNTAEPPVEGFSSFLWMLIIAAGDKIGISPFVLSKMIGVLSFCAMPLILLKSAHSVNTSGIETLAARRTQFLCAAMVISIYLPLAYYSVSGMEVTFFSVQLLGCVLLPYLLRNNVALRYVGAILAVTIVETRPEGLLIVFLVFPFWLYHSEAPSWYQKWPVLGLFSGFMAFLLLSTYRFIHFGEIVPNTYFAKATGGSAFHRFSLGAAYLLHFSLGIWPMLIATATFICVSKLNLTKSPLNKFLYILFVLYVIYIVKVGGDPESAFPVWRQFAHIAPIWILIFSAALTSAIPGRSHALIVALVIALVTNGWIIAFHRVLLLEEPLRVLSGRGVLKQMPENEGFVWLRRYSNEHTLTAVSLAGQWPYFVPGRYIDMLGLNDRYIAKHGQIQMNSNLVDSKSDMHYVLSRHPDIIDGYVSGRDLVMGKCPTEIHGGRSQMLSEMIHDTYFQNNYVFVRNGPYESMDRALFFRRAFLNTINARELDVQAVDLTVLYQLGCTAGPPEPGTAR